MSPTQASQVQEAPQTLEGNLQSEVTVELKMEKFPILKDVETQLRFVVEEIDKLTKHAKNNGASPPPSTKLIVNYGRVWFEGPLSDKYSQVIGLSPQSSSPSPPVEEEDVTGIENISTFLCLEREKHSSADFVTLQEWLECRQDQCLSSCQIFHLIVQLAKAVNFVVESGVQFKKGGLTLSNVDLIQDFTCPISHFIPVSTSLPKIKLSKEVFQFEAVISSLESPSLIENCSPAEKMEETPLQFISRVFGLLGGNGIISDDKCSSEVTLKNLVVKLEDQLKDKDGFIFNLSPRSKQFFGRERELKSLEGIITESPANKVIVVHGPAAIGKSELVTQLCQKVLETGGPPHLKKNVIWLEASSPDNLTASVYTCANLRRISLVDYIGQPRLLKDIFLELVASFGESGLLLVLDNATVLSVETLDLIGMFKEHSSLSSSSAFHHHLIVITRKLWTSCPLLEDSNCTTLYLTEISRESSSVTRSGEEYLEDLLQGSAAALKIIRAYQKAMPGVNSDLLKALETFPGEHPELLENVQDSALRPVCLAYAFSLWNLYQSLEERMGIVKLLYILEHVDGHSGIFKETLIEVFNQFSAGGASSGLSISSLLSSLCRYSLIQISDGVIRLPCWGQYCIHATLNMMISTKAEKETLCDKLLSAYFLVLSSKSSEADCWKVIGHAAKFWRDACRRQSDLAKRFEFLPDLIGKLGKSFKKLELILGFLKESLDIFSTAYQDPYDIHVLRLKILVTVDSLLAKGQVNEAFIVFKSIQDHCPTEPREYLMLKLRSLVELGKIHVGRQEYEKGISCFQQVHMLAAQKISTLQQDSEVMVLSARLYHGHAHLQQGNLEEAKKIILGVIPLLERYSGEDNKEHVKLLVQEARFYLGVLLRKTGDLVNALMIQTKVLEERELRFGESHPSTWASKREMSMLYSAYDNHEKALLILKQLLEIQEQVLGAPSNRHSLATMNAIAEIEARLGNFDDALELYEAIDLIEQQVLPENDEMRITSQLSQAEVLQNLGQYKEAIDIYDLVYTLLSSSIPSSSTPSRSELCQSILGKREKAERSMEVLGNYWLSLTPSNVDDPSELAALAKKHEVAVQLSENQDNQGALRFLREVMEDCGHLEESNRFHLNVKADLARVLGLVGRFNESFSVYKEIIPLMDATFGETDELTMLCKDTMGQVFLFSGNQFLKRQMSNLKWFLV